MSQIHYLSYTQSEGLMKALGFKTLSVTPETDLHPLLKKLKKQGCQVIFLSQEVYQDHQKLIKTYQADFDLTISVIQKENSQNSIGLNHLNQLMKEAIGVSFERKGGQ